MVKRIFFLSIIIVLNIVTYYAFGKEKMFVDFVKKESISINKESVSIDRDSINVFFISNRPNFCKKKRETLEFFFKKKEKSINFSYIKKSDFKLTRSTSNYVLEIMDIKPLLSLTNKAVYGKSDWYELNSVYIWCFYKWVRVYKEKQLIL